MPPDFNPFAPPPEPQRPPGAPVPAKPLDPAIKVALVVASVSVGAWVLMRWKEKGDQAEERAILLEAKLMAQQQEEAPAHAAPSVVVVPISHGGGVY